jgi:hypothetical protein
MIPIVVPSRLDYWRDLAATITPIASTSTAGNVEERPELRISMKKADWRFLANRPKVEAAGLTAERDRFAVTNY